ncbi:MAG: insulinase family protein [Prevotellaceae bacterium]|nr:insulinase family protein [Prevotellaceae bacterium]
MKFKSFFVALLLMVVGVAQAQQMPPIPVDEAVKIGKLDNGLTYYIRYNNWPENRANFYIAQRVGSLQEEESQRGLAHFLEHMCFNGTDNFPGNGVIRFCESIGVQFGAELNAFTSIDKTVYNIDNVPTANVAALDSCLLILHDWADGLTLDPEEIDKERGVIHEEWRLRTSASSRMLERNLETLYPGSKYGRRYPIGTMEVIDNFKYQELRDYYEKWYHPSNQAIIVVGDIDVDRTEAKIKEIFGGIKEPENAAPVELVEVPDNAEPIIIIDKDKEFQRNAVEIMFKSDAMPEEMKGTMQYMMVEYLIYAATAMLNQRYTEAVQKADCPFVNAGANYGRYIFSKTKDAFDIDVVPKDPTQIEAALKAALVEARRAAEFGFTATEYDRYKEQYIAYLDKALSNKDKRQSKQFCQEYWQHYLENEPIPSIDFEVETMKQIIPMLPLQAINELMKQFIPETNENMVIINFNNEAEGAVYPTKESLLNAVAEARAAEVEAFVDNVKNEPLIAKMPKAGKIKSEKKNDKFGYSELELSNGVKVILKKTDFKKDQVTLSGSGKGGETLYGAKDYTNLQVFDNVIGMSGLGNFSSTELQKALAGKIANADLSISERYTEVNGSSTPKDVETMLQMVYLYFTNISKDEDSFATLMSQLQVGLQNRELNPDIALSDSITATLYNHNPRLAPLTLDRLPEISYDRILEIAKERTASAKGWEFTIIGNYDEETIRPLICQYLAALPAKKANVESKRERVFQKGLVENRFTRKQETPKATAIIVWQNPDMEYTQERNIQIDMIGQILDMELLNKIREEASAAYSVSGAGRGQIGTDGYHNFVIQAYCPMKPEKSDVAIDIMLKEVPAMMENIDAEKLTKVKELMLKQYDDNQKKNGYWENAIFMWDHYGIDIQTNGREVIERQTVDTLKAFMKDFLKDNNNRISVVMLPEE